VPPAPLVESLTNLLSLHYVLEIERKKHCPGRRVSQDIHRHPALYLLTMITTDFSLDQVVEISSNAIESQPSNLLLLPESERASSSLLRRRRALIQKETGDGRIFD
ncbi:MAG: hypothetical protein K2Z81_13150, partial [Cyanobacteria bacterium]|nr:hypothetical protein [Cyanobacteriota bacterium]